MRGGSDVCVITINHHGRHKGDKAKKIRVIKSITRKGPYNL